ncbi:urease accessory protein [Acinetobacter marinus]|uniref:Urease accessory protein UreD n=1 Tax=Acinetobacter marinus TaxID=281375 RepID=A0A1G6JPQ3_9GAMM|nr:urease accessory protein UreD [Acinetobacter marinus]SDC20742.1 urease accessory protein [Acinetobacter marinus]
MNQSIQLNAHPIAQKWFAKLELKYGVDQNRTILVHRKHFGPIRVQKMLWPEKTGVCHTILVHPPAGIAGGDHLSFDVEVEAKAHALITTPGAGKWYKTNQKQAHQHIHLTVKDDGILEWLPQETMLFDGANAQSETHIQLDDVSCFIGWDMLVIGRQARAETFQTGHYHNQFRLHQNGALLIADTLSFHGKDRFLTSCLGMAGHAVMGSFWAVAPSQNRSTTVLESQIDLIRELIMRMDFNVTLTLVNGVICARYLGDDVRQCHDAFAAIRARLRHYWLNLDEAFPRIWRT